MKEFFKFVFASMIGVVLAFFAIVVILSILVAGIISSADGDAAVVSANSVMHVELNYPINERTSKNPLDKFFLNISHAARLILSL